MSTACLDKIRWDGLEAMPSRTDACFEMAPQRRSTGLWLAALESSQFCADEPGRPATKCEFKAGSPMTWLETKDDYTADGKLYRIDFVGRRTAHAGHFGAYGFYQHEMIVDHMISIKEIGAPPPTSKAQDQGSLK